MIKKIWNRLSDHESAGSGITVISAIGMTLGVLITIGLA